MTCKNINGKNAQIQIMQTVIIIIVIFIILFIGFLFYMQYSKESADKDLKQMESKKAIIAASYVLSIPEISCSEQLDVKQNCFDASKMLVFNATSNVEYYSSYFYNSRITVNVFYGNQSSGGCTKLNFPKCNEFVLYENIPDKDSSLLQSDKYYIPVSVYDPFLNRYYAAYAIIEVYM